MTETKNNPETSNQTELPHNPATNSEPGRFFITFCENSDWSMRL